MKPRDYAQHLRSRGYTYPAIKAFIRALYGVDVHVETIAYWTNPNRQQQIRDYMRDWMRRHRAAGKTGKPIVDRKKFDVEGPFEP